MSSALIREYGELYRDGHTLAPITVFQDGADYWVADGFHRTEGARHAGLTAITVDLQPGTKRDAILYSCGANKHGKVRTPGDRKRAVKRMLQDPLVLQEWTNAQIARHCGVVESFVRKVKRETGDEPRPYHRRDNRTGAIVPTSLDTPEVSEDMPQVAPPAEIEAHTAVPTEARDTVHIDEEPADDLSRAAIEARFPPAASDNGLDAGLSTDTVVEDVRQFKAPARILASKRTEQIGSVSQFNRT